MTSYKGIDYGNGQTNIDHASGIRFGVIPANDVGQAWYDGAESDYGAASCPKCGNEAEEAKGKYRKYEHSKHECDDYVCHACKYVFGSESAYGDSPLCEYIDNGEYRAYQHRDDCDIFIEHSLYYTYAQFCSPCAPGACYLRNELDGSLPENYGNRCYCFGHDMFEDNKAPYRVFRVDDNSEVLAE